MALPRTITVTPQNQRGSKDRRASTGTGSTSPEWASAYLSNWFEECDAAPGRPERRPRRRPSVRPRADSPVPAGRPRTFHDSSDGLMRSTRDLLSSLQSLDYWPDPREGGEDEDGARLVKSKSSKSLHNVQKHCSSGSRSKRGRKIDSSGGEVRDSAYGRRWSTGFVDMSDPSNSKAQHRLSRAYQTYPTDSGQQASAYLSHWFEKSKTASGSGRRPNARPRADSPVPAGRPRTFHSHDSSEELMRSTRDLLNSLQSLDDWPEPREGGEDEDGARLVKGESSKSLYNVRQHCSSGSRSKRGRKIDSSGGEVRDSACDWRSRSADSLSFDFVNASGPSYSKAQHRVNRAHPIDPTDSGQQARKVHFSAGADGNGTANHQDPVRAESAAMSLKNPPNEPPPAISGSSTRILNLPWTDHQGFQAYYSGGINKLMQPHGFGTLVYEDGRSVWSRWNNGSSLQDDWHHRWKKKRSASCTYPKPRRSTIDRKPSGSFKASQIDREASQSPSCIRELPVFPVPPFSPPRYDLGDVGAPEDMIAVRDPVEAHRNISSLKMHDFAFVLRSDGTWTYAIVADFPKMGTRHASMRFVMNKRGNTKTVKQRHWAKFVRRVSWSRDDDNENDTSDALPANDAGAPRSRPHEKASKRKTGETLSFESDQAIFPWQHHTIQRIRRRGGRARRTKPHSISDDQSMFSASCPVGELFGGKPSY